MKKLIIISVIVAVVSIFAVPAAILADPVEKVDAFVCPVLKPVVGNSNNPNIFPIANGNYSLLPGKAGGPDEPGHTDSPVSVPVHATNGDGAGSPGGWHAETGDQDYTAIWSLE